MIRPRVPEQRDHAPASVALFRLGQPGAIATLIGVALFVTALLAR